MLMASIALSREFLARVSPAFRINNQFALPQKLICYINRRIEIATSIPLQIED